MKKSSVVMISLLLVSMHCEAINFPSNSSNASLYSLLGGGQSVPDAAVSNGMYVPLNANTTIGAGYSCGRFSQLNTIANSLNNFKDSIQNVPSSIVGNAKSAIISFPMYKLAQSDPKLYNILNNNVIGAHNQYALNLKSCYQMQNEAITGKDPYNKWLWVSNNNNMKTVMSLGDGGADLNKATAKVHEEQGKHGVPWATPGTPVGTNAGGEGQPPIMVIHDTAVAGYNVLLGRDATATNPPDKTADNQNLLNYWGMPEDAAKWIVSVTGDQKVTTCTDCKKSSSPGRGLLPYIQKLTTDLNKKIGNLIAHPDQVNEKSLLEISAPGQVVSPSLLQSIRQMEPNAQQNTIGTLSQNIATTRVVNEALLAKNILETGAQVPAIHAVPPAQTVIKQRIQLLQSDISQIMYSIKIRQQLNAHVMSNIMAYNQAQNEKAASVPRIGNQQAVMTDGAIVKQDQS